MDSRSLRELFWSFKTASLNQGSSEPLNSGLEWQFFPLCQGCYVANTILDAQECWFTVHNAWFRNWGLISPSLHSEKAVLSLLEDWVLGLGSVSVTSSLETCFLESSHLGQLSEISPSCLPHPYNLSLEYHSFVPSPYCVHHIPTSFDRCPFTFLERITCLSPSLGSPSFTSAIAVKNSSKKM